MVVVVVVVLTSNAPSKRASKGRRRGFRATVTSSTFRGGCVSSQERQPGWTAEQIDNSAGLG